MAFIGPTGVGKTTTLAKLVAQFALFRNKKAALLTIDTYRIGAVEQLKTYSEIIGVPLDVVNTPEELKDSLQRHRDKEAIFIDTAGRSVKNKEQVLELQRFIDLIPERRDIFLTLSATTKGKDLSKIIEEYQRLKFNKLIITKIDETLNLGCIVNVADQAGMPVVYVTKGQNVPDDIEELSPEKAAGMVLRGGKQLEGSGL
jgi:flagellar biosynthesis protein FlhF